MSQAHKGSRLISNNSLKSVDSNTVFLAHYDITENDVLCGIAPIQNVTTMRDGKFGGGIAVEEGTTNTWVTGISIYNNYGVPATITQTGEYYLGQPVWRLAMTVDTAHSANLSHFQTTLTSHGVYGGSQSFVIDTSYASSIYWRPVNKLDTVFGGTASNIAGWSSGGNTIQSDGWRRFYRYRTGTGVATVSDNVHHSFYCPSLQLDETIYIDVCFPQTEQGRTFPTSPVIGTRETGILKYDKVLLSPSEGTISFWLYAHGNLASMNPIYSSGIDSNAGTFDFLIQRGQNPYVRAYHYSDTTSAQLRPAIDVFDKWTHISVVWKKNTLFEVFANGVSVAKTTTPVDWGSFNNATGFFLGSGVRSNPSIIVDELRIDNIARTDEEMLSWYLSGAPFFPRGVYTVAY